MSVSTGKHSWIKLHPGKGINCPICDKDHTCMIDADGTAAICFRVETGCAKRKDGSAICLKDSMGWLHRKDKSKGWRNLPKLTERVAKIKPLLKAKEIAAILKRNAEAVRPDLLEIFAKSLGVSVKALQAYEVGWDADYGCWSAPMRDASGDAIGIHLRRESDGRKLCVKRTSNGLFIPNDYLPSDLPDGSPPLVVLTPEGLTDACAAYDFGYWAIGRFNNMGGGGMLRQFLDRFPKQDVVLCGERDGPPGDMTKFLPDGTPYWPGIEGPLRIAAQILPACHRLRFLLPPDGAKDIREIAKENQGLSMLIDKAPVVDAEWLKRANWKIQQRKKNERKK